MTHTDIYDMIVEMKQYAAQNGGAIRSNDLPMELSYTCENTGKNWTIQISDLKISINNTTHSEFEINMLKRAFTSQEAKQVLLDMINGK